MWSTCSKIQMELKLYQGCLWLSTVRAWEGHERERERGECRCVEAGERERRESFRVRLRNDFVRSLDGGWWIVSSSTKIQSGRIFESDFTTVLVRTATKNCISRQLLIISPWNIQAQNYGIFIKYQNCHHLLRFHGRSIVKDQITLLYFSSDFKNTTAFWSFMVVHSITVVKDRNPISSIFKITTDFWSMSTAAQTGNGKGHLCYNAS